MISILTSDGSKNLILRGVRTDAGNRAIVAASITAPGDDFLFWDGSALAALTVTAEPTFVQGAMAMAIAVAVTTEGTVAAATGGSAPYTYAWTVEDDGGFFGWDITAPTAALTYFRGLSVEPGENWLGTMRCTATDARGATGYVDVPVSIANYGSL